jgi:TP901 family phage tail tape measure protein
MGLQGNDLEFALRFVNEGAASLEQAAKQMRGLGTDAKKTQTYWEKTGITMRDVGRAIGWTTGVLLSFRKGLKVFEEFDVGIRNVQTLMPESVAQVEEMGLAIEDMAVSTGVATKTLTDGLYQVVSAFGATKDSIDILRIANESAVAGLATTEQAVALLSSVMKGYGDTSSEAADHISDLAQMTVKLGQTTFGELAQSIRKVVPLAFELNVTTEELFNTFATLTGVTGDTRRVSTQYQGVLRSLLKPQGRMAEMIQATGFASAKTLIQVKGFQGALEALNLAAIKGGVGLEEFFIETEGLVATLSLLGSQSDVTKVKLTKFAKAAGERARAFEIQMGSLKTSFGQLRESVAVIWRHIGSTLAPWVKEMAAKVVIWARAYVALEPQMKLHITQMGIYVSLLAMAVPLLTLFVKFLKPVFGMVRLVSTAFMSFNLLMLGQTFPNLAKAVVMFRKLAAALTMVAFNPAFLAAAIAIGGIMYALDAMGISLSEQVAAIGNLGSIVLRELKTWVAYVYQYKDEIIGTVKAVMKAVMLSVRAVMRTFGAVLLGFAGLLTGNIEMLRRGAELLEEAMSDVGSAFLGATEAVQRDYTRSWVRTFAAVAAGAKMSLETLKGVLSDPFFAAQPVATINRHLMHGLVDVSNAMQDALYPDANAFVGPPEKIKEGAKKTLDDLRAEMASGGLDFDSLFGSAKGGGKAAINKILSFFGFGPGQLPDALKEAFAQASVEIAVGMESVAFVGESSSGKQLFTLKWAWEDPEGKMQTGFSTRTYFANELEAAKAAIQAGNSSIRGEVVEVPLAQVGYDATLAPRDSPWYENLTAIRAEAMKLQESLPGAVALREEYDKTIRLLDAALSGNEHLTQGIGELRDAALVAYDEGLSQLYDLEEPIDSMEGFISAWKMSFKQIGDESQITGTNIKDIMGDAMEGMADSLTDFVMTGKSNFADFAKSLIKDIARIIIKAKMLQFLKAMMPGTFGEGGTVGAEVDALGGMVGRTGAPRARVPASMFAGAGSYAMGGAVPVIAHKGEGIFTPKQMNNADMLFAKLQQNSSPSVTVNISTPPGTSATVQEKRGGGAGGQDVQMEVLVEMVESKMSSRLQSGGGLAPALEQQYGLDRSRGQYR